MPRGERFKGWCFFSDFADHSELDLSMQHATCNGLNDWRWRCSLDDACPGLAWLRQSESRCRLALSTERSQTTKQPRCPYDNADDECVDPLKPNYPRGRETPFTSMQHRGRPLHRCISISSSRHSKGKVSVPSLPFLMVGRPVGGTQTATHTHTRYNVTPVRNAAMCSSHRPSLL